MYGILCLFCISCCSFVSKCSWFNYNKEPWWYLWFLECFLDCCIDVSSCFFCLFNCHYGYYSTFFSQICSFWFKFSLVSYMDLWRFMLKSIGHVDSFDSWNAQYLRYGTIFSQQISKEDIFYCKNLESIYVCITDSNGFLLCCCAFWFISWKILLKCLIFQKIILTLWYSWNSKSRPHFNILKIRIRWP